MTYIRNFIKSHIFLGLKGEFTPSDKTMSFDVISVIGAISVIFITCSIY